jgi:NadR type nicotinamide-nucleotide adenylyltransferase
LISKLTIFAQSHLNSFIALHQLYKRIVIIGPESTGKSTLTKHLSQQFKAPSVPEFARTYLESLNRPYVQEDLLIMAEAQLKVEDAVTQDSSSEWLFCDTDLHVIKVWSESKYNTCNEKILQLIALRKYDFYILTDIDMPWQDDPLREHPEPEMREHFFNIYMDIVLNTGVPFVIVKGDEKQRLNMALEALLRI